MNHLWELSSYLCSQCLSLCTRRSFSIKIPRISYLSESIAAKLSDHFFEASGIYSRHASNPPLFGSTRDQFLILLFYASEGRGSPTSLSDLVS